MKIHCRDKEMVFGDATFPNGLVVRNYSVTVADEVGSRLVLEHPSLFSMRAFAKSDRRETVYSATPAEVVVEDASEQDEGSS